MERGLVEWLLKERDSVVLDNLKILSNHGLHISIDSLRNIFYGDICKEKLYYGLCDNLLTHLRNSSLKELLKNIKDEKSDIVYNFTHPALSKNVDPIIKGGSTLLQDFPLLKSLDIIRNNRMLLIKKRSIDYQLKYCESIYNYKYGIVNNNNYFNNNNNKNYEKNLIINKNENVDNSLLFFKIWRNLIIKECIILEVSRINNHFKKRFTFYSIEEFDSYRFKEYITHLELILTVTTENDCNLDCGTINDYLEFKLPSSVTILEINGGFNKYIKPESLPSTIRKLSFNRDNLEPGVKKIGLNVPVGFANLNTIFDDLNPVKKIVFPENYNSKIYDDSIPEGVEIIDYRSIFIARESIDAKMFPKSLKQLIIYRQFDSTIFSEEKSILPPVETLFIRNLSLLTVGILPESITDLEIEWPYSTFNMNKVKKCLFPQQLKKLILSGYYNEIGKGVLPPNLTHLTLSVNHFKTIEPGCLPDTLKYLSFQGRQKLRGKEVSKPFKKSQPVLIKGSLPTGLTTLKLSKYQLHLDILIKGVISKHHKSLTKISICPNYILDYKTDYKKPIENLSERISLFFKKKSIPSTIKKFTCKTVLNYPEMVLILPCTHFKILSSINDCEDLLCDSYIKSSSSLSKCTYILLPDSFNTNLTPKSFPDTLLTLKFQGRYNTPILPMVLPKSLKILIFDHEKSNFNHDLSGCLPIGLKCLVLGPHYDKTINFVKNLQELEFLVIGNSNPSTIILNDNHLKKSKLKQIIIFNTNNQFLKNNNHSSIIYSPILKIIQPQQLESILNEISNKK
ncbi:hypothetical protein ACTFIV_001325 [Dictyostelium citrinum]